MKPLYISGTEIKMNKIRDILTKYGFIIFQVLFGIFYALTILDAAYIKELFLSADSVGYLREAEAIRLGYGFNYYGPAGGYEWFAAFPIGYPALIAFFTTVFGGHNSYLCSKILSAVLVFFILIYFTIRYKKNSWIYSLLLLNWGILAIYKFTWSETLFIPMLMLFCAVISHIITIKDPGIKWYVFLYLTIMGTFMSRYFGMVTLIFAGIIWIIMLISFMRGDHDNRNLLNKVIRLIPVGAVSAVSIGAYLLMNLKMNGYATGVVRSDRPSDFASLRLDLYKAIEAEVLDITYKYESPLTSSYTVAAKCILAIIIIAIPVYILARRKKADEPAVFISFGLTYLTVFTIVRFFSSMNPFNYRFFAPGTLLILTGMVSIALDKFKDINLKPAAYIISALLILAILSMLPDMKKITSDETAYQAEKNACQITTMNIPSHVAVINYDIDYKCLYWRTDSAFYGVISPEDEMDDIIARYSGYDGVCIKREEAIRLIGEGTCSASVEEQLKRCVTSSSESDEYIYLYRVSE